MPTNLSTGACTASVPSRACLCSCHESRLRHMLGGRTWPPGRRTKCYGFLCSIAAMQVHFTCEHAHISESGWLFKRPSTKLLCKGAYQNPYLVLLFDALVAYLSTHVPQHDRPISTYRDVTALRGLPRTAETRYFAQPAIADDQLGLIRRRRV